MGGVSPNGQHGITKTDASQASDYYTGFYFGGLLVIVAQLIGYMVFRFGCTVVHLIGRIAVRVGSATTTEHREKQRLRREQHTRHMDADLDYLYRARLRLGNWEAEDPREWHPNNEEADVPYFDRPDFAIAMRRRDERLAREELEREAARERRLAQEPAPVAPVRPPVPGPLPVAQHDEARVRSTAPACPLCGATTRVRYARADGHPFRGCVRFPQCRGSLPAEQEFVDAWAERAT